MEDRKQRLPLGSLGRVHRAEIYHRMGVGHYQGMAGEHLLMHLTRVREKTHRIAIRLQQKGFWEVLMQQQRVGKSNGQGQGQD